MIDTDAALAPFEVDDLDGDVLLDLISDNTDQEWRAERRRLRLAYQLCVTHPAVEDDPASWADGIPDLAGYTDTLGGEGTPEVAAFTVELWATAAGVSTWSAKRTLAATLDLHHRLPCTWAAVEELRIPGWKACRVAEDTNRFSLEAATWVDVELARRGTWGLPTIEKTIKAAMAMFHPDLVKNNGLPGRDDWDVTVDHAAGVDGTSRLDAIGDSVDLETFHSLLADEAATMGRLGDTDTLGQRKAKALGVLADRQATADLLGLLDNSGTASGSGSSSGETGHGAGEDPNNPAGGLVHPVTGKPVTRRRSYLKTRLYVHLTLTDLATMAGAAADGYVAATNLFGTVHLDTLTTWLRDLGTNARVTPVIDTNRDWAVDHHDPPETMREQVILRDRHCVFPWCTVDARNCDLDHIEPYDEHGPPDQTRPDNLAPLCRRHHLAKTHGTWRYVRNRDGTYTWTNHTHTWLVTHDGTTSLTDP
ncbi:HNH endonuclease signature motif containing protein [Nocardioides sp. AE5]|uniref:HNH endonuclease signature motif containing protein n=1 Tax=Nocardioides sp. AE5 TaxID=2962573 RepID=UPI002881CB12|nr:HNH endonuclease signature motif containing protein [Nocardioides sp. AE5]MDT0201284.1 HNH endonuclease signature motif containing protein [Nocardioides sp. AE5]